MALVVCQHFPFNLSLSGLPQHAKKNECIESLAEMHINHTRVRLRHSLMSERSLWSLHDRTRSQSAILKTRPSLSWWCVSVRSWQEVHCVVCRAELQAAGRVHRDPAPAAQHRQGLLEAGVRLRMHLHRHAERDRSGSGEILPLFI